MDILIVSPHADDEVLGCGGMILKRVAEGHGVDVVVAAISTVHDPTGGDVKATSDIRREELAEAARRLGVSETHVLFDDRENRLDTLAMMDIVSELDRILARKSYEQVFLPYPSHHKDHRLMYEAGFSALRQKGARHFPGLVAMYEYAYIGWAPTEVRGGRMYLDITEQMEGKERALEAYASQLQEAPHPISVEAMRTLAAMRGMECGRRFAELFYVLKTVE